MPRPTFVAAQINRDSFNVSLSQNWTNQFGDRFDSNYAAQGNSPWASVNVIDNDTPRFVTIDVTSLAQQWFANPNQSTWIWLIGSSTAVIQLALKGNTTAANRPKISYNGQAPQECDGTVVLNSSSIGGIANSVDGQVQYSTTAPFERIAIAFPAPTVAVTNATITLYTTAQFLTGDIRVFQGRAPGEIAPNVSPPNSPALPTISVLSTSSFQASCTDASTDETGFEWQYRSRLNSADVLGTYGGAAGSPTAAGVVALTITDTNLIGKLVQFQVRSTNAAGPSAWVESTEFWMPNTGTGGGEIPAPQFLTISGLTTGVAGSVATVTVRDDVNALVSGATLAWTGSPAGSSGGTTNGSGQASVTLPNAGGSYTLTATKGAIAANQSVTVTPLLTALAVSVSTPAVAGSAATITVRNATTLALIAGAEILVNNVVVGVTSGSGAISYTPASAGAYAILAKYSGLTATAIVNAVAASATVPGIVLTPSAKQAEVGLSIDFQCSYRDAQNVAVAGALLDAIITTNVPYTLDVIAATNATGNTIVRIWPSIGGAGSLQVKKGLDLSNAVAWEAVDTNSAGAQWNRPVLPS
jgi:hypothetical protein